MIEDPDYIHTSGRESLTVADRCGLLAAEFQELRAHGPHWHQDVSPIEYMDIHNWCSFLGMVDGVAQIGEAGTQFHSRVECLVLAWRRGGMREWKRIRALQGAK